MLRTGLITIAMIAALQGICFGQGFLDSTLGPGGLGLWGRGDAASQQYKNPQMWEGAQGPNQHPYQQPAASGQPQITYPPAAAQAHPQNHPGNGDGYRQPGYSYQQEGVYAHPPNYPPAQIAGNPDQYSSRQAFSAQQQYQEAFQQYQEAQQKYQEALQQYQAFQQYQPPQQSQAPQQYTAPPAQAFPGRPAQAAPGQPSLRPGQYAPGQAPVATDYPDPGAGRMTTTPTGAWVRHYPPADEPGAPQATSQRPARRLKPKPAAAKVKIVERAQPREQTTRGTKSPGRSAMEMLQPDEILRSLDHRYGWDTAVTRGPVAAPAAR